MNNHWIIIRIVLALVAIFALGIWVGRITGPEVSSEPLEISIEAGDSTDEKALKKATVRVLTKYRIALGLTKEQVRRLRPMFVKASRRMQILPRLSKARLAVLEDFHGEIREHLTEEQKVKLTGMMELAEARDRE